MTYYSRARSSRAQDVIICDFCENPTKQFCNSCQVSLCEDCKTKHKSEFKSLSHEFVPFQDRNITLAFPECRDHPGKRCEAHCKQCHIPVCIKCFMGTHQGHDAEELTQETRIKEIQHEVQEIKKNLIPKCQKEDSNTETAIYNAIVEFDIVGGENKATRELWHKEVDTLFDKIETLRQSHQGKKLDSLRAYQTKIKNLISDMKKTTEHNEKILKSGKLSQINTYQSKLRKYQQDPEKVHSKMPTVNTKIIQGKDLMIAFGDLKATMTQGTQATPFVNVINTPVALAKPSRGFSQLANIPELTNAQKCRPPLNTFASNNIDSINEGYRTTASPRIRSIAVSRSSDENLSSDSDEYAPMTRYGTKRK